MYRQLRKKVVHSSIIEDLVYAFTDGAWSKVLEYGDREGSVEPCIMSQNPHFPIHGVVPYQGAYYLYHGVVPEVGQCISHRCRNQRNTTSTRCCNPTHMFIRNQRENRKRSQCHKAIVKEANRKKQLESDPLCGAVDIGKDCSHQGSDGKEFCIISYGVREDVSDSVSKYVLRRE